MLDLIVSSQDQAAPPEELSQPLRAMWWLKKGNLKLGDEWEKAHSICQEQEGEKQHDWVHAIAHMIEGDEWNSNYWYRRVGEDRASENVEKEWVHIVGQISG